MTIVMVNWIDYPKTLRKSGQTRKMLEDKGITETKEYYESNIGKKVAKANNNQGSQPNPFKSGSKVNTVKGVVLHPQLTEIKGEDIWGYTFEEDDSIVECRRCFVIDPRESLKYIEEWQFCECGQPYMMIGTGVYCPRCKFTFQR